MATSVTRMADEIVARLVAAAVPGRAEDERRYLKSELTFLGTPYWQVGKIVRELAAPGRRDHDVTVRLAATLWGPPVFERRAAATAVLEIGAATLSAADLPLLERFLRESGTWALVDDLAVSVVGSIVQAEPDAARPVLDAWAADADFWIRRASLLGELRALKDGAGLAPFASRADAMLDEREFFIRKAIGWVLREVGKRRPREVVSWLEPRVPRASGVTMREAVKYLPPDDAARLMARYREISRPARSRTRRTRARA